MIADADDADEGLPAGAAEDVREDRLLAVVVVLEYPRLQRYEAVAILIQRGVDRTGLGDELVELERQNGVAFAAGLESLVDLTDPLQQSVQGILRGRLFNCGICREELNHFRGWQRRATEQMPC